MLNHGCWTQLHGCWTQLQIGWLVSALCSPHQSSSAFLRRPLHYSAILFILTLIGSVTDRTTRATPYSSAEAGLGVICVLACWRVLAFGTLTVCVSELSNCLSSREIEEVTLRPCPLPPSSLSSVAPGSSTKRPTSFLISFLRLTTLVCRPFHHPSPSGLGPAPFR